MGLGVGLQLQHAATCACLRLCAYRWGSFGAGLVGDQSFWKSRQGHVALVRVQQLASKVGQRFKGGLRAHTGSTGQPVLLAGWFVRVVAVPPQCLSRVHILE